MNASVNERIAKLSNRTKIALACGAAFVVSPVIFVTVKGLVGLAAAGVVGLAIVNAAPVLAMKFANWKLKGIVAEAKENPIETLQNLLIAKRQAFRVLGEKVTDAVTARDNFKNKVTEFQKQYPARAAEFQMQYERMAKNVAKKIQAYKDAEQQLRIADDKLEEMKAYWDMSQALQQANKATGLDTGDLYEKLKADTASSSVLESVNRAFAQLEVEAALDYNSPNDVTPVDTPAQLSYNTDTVFSTAQVVQQTKVK